MPFPIIPVVATAGIAGLGYLLFGKKEEPKGATIPLPGGGSAQLPAPKTPQEAQQQAAAVQVAQATQQAAAAASQAAYIPGVTPQAPGAPPFIPGVMPPLPSRLPGIMPAPTPVVAPSFPLSGVFPGVSGPPSSSATIVRATPGINIRSKPDASSARVGGANTGERVRVEGTLQPPSAGAPQGWWLITNQAGIKGYGTAEFMQFDMAPQVSPLPAPPTPGPLANLPSIPGLPVIPGLLPASLPTAPSALVLTGTIRATPGANLRSTPSTSGSILMGLNDGTKVRIVDPIPSPPNAGAPSGWLKVMSPTNVTGFVAANYVIPDMPGGLSIPGLPGMPTITGDPMTPRRRRKGYAING